MEFRRSLLISGVCLSTYLLAACGGGSGGGDEPDNSNNNPEPTASYMIGGTITGLVSSGLMLENNGGDTISVDGASFEFATAVTDGNTYAVTVASHPDKQLCSVEDGAGMVAGAAVDDIHVVCRYWRVEELVETDDSGSADMPMVGVDGDGRVIAVWQQSDGAHERIWSSAFVPGNGWNTPVRIDQAGTADTFSPSIAVDSDGSAIAVWDQNESGVRSFWVNVYHPDTGWGTATLTPGTTPGAARPSFVFVETGRAIAVWSEDYSLWSADYSEDTGWGTAALIESNAGSASDVRLATGGDGTVAAVWLQHDGSPYSMWANIYSGGRWGQAVPIEAIGGSAYDAPSVDVDLNGNVIAVWRHSDQVKSSIWSSSYRPGSGWGDAELLETNDVYHAYSPSVAFDSQGNAMAVWYHYGTESSIAANLYSPTSGWAGAVQVPAGEETGTVDNPQVVFTPADHAILVWNWNADGQQSLRTTTYTNIDGWGQHQLIEMNDSGHAGESRLVVDGSGNATAIWQQHDGVRYSIWANRFE